MRCLYLLPSAGYIICRGLVGPVDDAPFSFVNEHGIGGTIAVELPLQLIVRDVRGI
jgi:hypothetical protein